MPNGLGWEETSVGAIAGGIRLNPHQLFINIAKQRRYVKKHHVDVCSVSRADGLQADPGATGI
jgi:hypothetical protein